MPQNKHDFFNYGYAAGGGRTVKSTVGDSIVKGITGFAEKRKKTKEAREAYTEKQKKANEALYKEADGDFGENTKIREAGVNIDGVKNGLIQEVRNNMKNLNKNYEGGNGLLSGLGIKKKGKLFKKGLSKAEYDSKVQEQMRKLDLLDGVDNIANGFSRLHTNDKGGKDAVQLSNNTAVANKEMSRKFFNNELTPSYEDGEIVWTDSTDGETYSNEEMQAFTKFTEEAPDPGLVTAERVAYIEEERNNAGSNRQELDVARPVTSDEPELQAKVAEWTRQGLYPDQIRYETGLFRSRQNAGLNEDELEREENVLEATYDGSDPSRIASEMLDYNDGKSAIANLGSWEDVQALGENKLRIPALSEEASDAKLAEYAKSWDSMNDRQKWQVLQTIKDEENVTLGKELYVNSGINALGNKLSKAAESKYGPEFNAGEARLLTSLSIDQKEQNLETGELKQQELVQKINKAKRDSKNQKVLAVDVSSLVTSSVQPLIAHLETLETDPAAVFSPEAASTVNRGLNHVNSIMKDGNTVLYEQDPKTNKWSFNFYQAEVYTSLSNRKKAGKVPTNSYDDIRDVQLEAMKHAGVKEAEIERTRLKLFPDLQKNRDLDKYKL